MSGSSNQGLSDQFLDTIFREARTHSYWQNKEISDDLIHSLYDLLKFAPTSANTGPARFVFVKSADAKARLKPFLDEGNVAKTMAAPVTVIIGYDRRFFEHMPRLFPHVPDARTWFEGNQAVIEDTAFRNSSLQGAYLILAARALGLDCGPMSGFDKAGVKKTFFPDADIQPNFLCNLGYGLKDKLHPRLPRLGFDEVCKIV